MDELKPCPFCGSSALAWIDNNTNTWIVKCCNPECIDMLMQSAGKWNNRPLEDALQAKLDEAVALLDRLSHWDMLNTYWDGRPATADGPYWKREIDELLLKIRGEE